jgi:flagellar motor switch protein FliM
VPYDFRRPIQLSREHSRMLQLAFDGFARQATTVFTSALRTVCAVGLVSVEQRTYAEYVDSLNSTTYLTMFSAEPIHARGVLEIPLAAVMTSIDHMLGGSGPTQQPERPLSEIESSVARSLIERLLGEMRYSMAGVLPLEPVVTGVEYSPQFAQVASAADVMVVAVLELHLVRASAPVPVSDRERAQQARATEQLLAGFQRVPVPVSVRVRPTVLGPDDLAMLQIGDVIRLDHPAAAPLEVVVDGTTFAHATAGTRGPRLAALIVATPKENA